MNMNQLHATLVSNNNLTPYLKMLSQTLSADLADYIESDEQLARWVWWGGSVDVEPSAVIAPSF